MKEIFSHRDSSEMHESLRIEVLQDPDKPAADSVQASKFQVYVRKHGNWEPLVKLAFQNKPVNLSPKPGSGIIPSEVEGLSNEVLLAVILYRLRFFQAGRLSCRQNELAMAKVEEALFWLKDRTRDRIEREVEGTVQP